MGSTICHHLVTNLKQPVTNIFVAMNDQNTNHSSAEQIVYPLYRIDRAKANTKRTSRLSLSKNKSRNVIRETESIPASPIVMSSFSLSTPTISHSPESSDEEIIPEIGIEKYIEEKNVNSQGNIEEKTTLPTGENGQPVSELFEQFDAEDGRVFRVCEAEIPEVLVLPLLDDPEFKFLDDYEPPAPVFSTARQQTSSHPQLCPLDMHDEYCGKFAKHSKYNCWEAQPWLMPLKLVQLRAADEYHSNYDRKDSEKSFRWQDILLRKSEGAEMDSLEQKRDEIALYENSVLQKAEDVRKEKEKLKQWEDKVRARFLPQHMRFPLVTRIRSEYQEVDVESLVDEYTEKVFEQYAETRDFEPNELPESVMQKDEDFVIFMRFNDNEQETKVIKKVGFSLGDTEECHHDVKVKFVPPFVPTRQYY